MDRLAVMKTFIRVVEAASFSAAAKYLNVGQPTVSKSVAQDGGGNTWTFRQGASKVSVSASGRLRVSAAEGVRAAVLGGMGLAITSEWMFTLELASRAVRTVLPEWTLPTIDLWAVFPTGRMASAKARAFVAFVEVELHMPHSRRE